jgi:hypothetical protein
VRLLVVTQGQISTQEITLAWLIGMSGAGMIGIALAVRHRVARRHGARLESRLLTPGRSRSLVLPFVAGLSLAASAHGAVAPPASQPDGDGQDGGHEQELEHLADLCA